MLGRAASAHRLDEYLQAARISVGQNAIRLDLSLAPGAAVARDFIAAVDADGDGMITVTEANAYATRALMAMSLSVDDEPMTLRLVSTDPPTPASLLAGEGVLRVRAETRFASPSPAGPHALRFENTFAPVSSVYLGNAMLPEDKTIAITDQDHGSNQSTLVIRYVIGRDAPIVGLRGWVLVMVAVAGGLALFAVRRARGRNIRST
jgi:hypothetical protein